MNHHFTLKSERLRVLNWLSTTAVAVWNRIKTYNNEALIGSSEYVQETHPFRSRFAHSSLRHVGGA